MSADPAPPPPGPSVGHRLQYLAFRVLAACACAVPERAALAFGSGLGWLAGSVLRLRRGVVDENLARAFPERDARWRRRVGAACYRHVGREGVVLLRLARLGPDAVRARTEMEGLEHVQGPLSRGEGVVLASAHLGNWEIGGAAFTVRGIPLEVVARRQRNPLFDAHIVRTRERLGMSVVYRQEARRRVLRSLRSGGAVALVADQNAHLGGVFVDFFGVPAATMRGPALLSLRTGAPLVLAVTLRLPGTPSRYRVRIRPLPKPASGDAEEDTRRLTRAYMAALEDFVREAPEQYFWLHRRWRTRP